MFPYDEDAYFPNVFFVLSKTLDPYCRSTTLMTRSKWSDDKSKFESRVVIYRYQYSFCTTYYVGLVPRAEKKCFVSRKITFAMISDVSIYHLPTRTLPLYFNPKVHESFQFLFLKLLIGDEITIFFFNRERLETLEGNPAQRRNEKFNTITSRFQ